MKHIITETSKYNSIDDYTRFSVSRIKCYKECSQMYKLRYVDKVDTYKHSNSTIVGNLLHSTLEYLYGVDDDDVKSPTHAFMKILQPEFNKLGIGSGESILRELLEYQNDINILKDRASANYVGPHPIRTSKGTIAKIPEMTSTWKKEAKRLDLNGRKERIDLAIQYGVTGLEEVSITEVFTKAYNLANTYITPNEFEEILYLELPLSNWCNERLINPLPFPGCKHQDIYLNGFIDNVAKLNINGKNQIAIIDYKTSKEIFNTSIVQHNQQLLIYAAGVEQLLDIPIEYIAILSLVKGDLIIVPIDREIQQEVINNFNATIDKILNSEFIKHTPDTKYSACLNSFGSTCPYLQHCWPKSYNYFYNDGLKDDYLNLTMP